MAKRGSNIYKRKDGRFEGRVSVGYIRKRKDEIPLRLRSQPCRGQGENGTGLFGKEYTGTV